MLKTLNALDWRTHLVGYDADGVKDENYKPGDRRSIQLNGSWKQGHDGGVEIEVRCASPVEINGITDSGETILLAWGQFALFKGRLLGFSGLEVVATENFSIRLASKTKWLEIPDPVPVVIHAEHSAQQPLQDAIREELTRWMGRESAKQFLKDDADIDELLDDVFNGDLEFEEEDHHGLPSMRGFEEEDEPEPEAPQEPITSSPRPADNQAAPKPAPKKDGGGAPSRGRKSQEADAPDDGADDE